MTEPCPICHGAHFICKDVPYGHPDFGRLFACQCWQDELARRKREQLADISGLKGDLLEKSFANFKPRNSIQGEALRFARAHAADPLGWLVLAGDNGCGKTHLAAAIANARLANDLAVLFVVVPDLLDHLRATYHPESTVRYDERFEQVRGHPFLILDDLGAESATAWAQEKLFQIINDRYNARLPTVVTTNLTKEQLPARLRVRVHDTKLATIVDFGAAPKQTETERNHPTRLATNRQAVL